VSDPPDDVYSALLKERSGFVTSGDQFVDFFYVLMRDHVTPGHIEYIMIQVDKEKQNNDLKHVDKTSYTNGWLASYAKDVVERLKGNIKTPAGVHSVAPQKYEIVEIPPAAPVKKHRVKKTKKF
jgi:hypothetical protein